MTESLTNCTTCHGTQWVLAEGYDLPLPCPTCGNKLGLIKAYEAKLHELFGYNVFRPQHVLADYLQLLPEAAEGKEFAIQATHWWSRHGGLLALYGASGRGKTSLAAAAIRHINHKVPVLHIDTETLFDLLRKGYDDKQRDNRVNALLHVPVLLLDDLGRLGQPPASPHDTKILRTILDGRYQQQQATIITSNLTPEQLSAQYDQTLIARLNRWAKRTLVDRWDDYQGEGWISMGGNTF